MAVQTTNVSLIAKLKSLGASFFRKYTTTKEVNEVITNMNDVGLCDIIIATAVSTTTDFGSLKVGDKVLVMDEAAGTPANTTGAYYMVCVTAVTLPAAAVISNIYVVLRPAA